VRVQEMKVVTARGLLAVLIVLTVYDLFVRPNPAPLASAPVMEPPAPRVFERFTVMEPPPPPIFVSVANVYRPQTSIMVSAVRGEHQYAASDQHTLVWQCARIFTGSRDYRGWVDRLRVRFHWDADMRVTDQWNRLGTRSHSTIAVEHRFGSGRLVQQTWEADASYSANFGLLPLDDVAAFTRYALVAQSVMLRVTGRDGVEIAATFPLDGLAKALTVLPCAAGVV
jgi:hypothetical protein